MQSGVRSLIPKTLFLASSMALGCLVPLKSATAQITPDSTLNGTIGTPAIADASGTYFGNGGDVTVLAKGDISLNDSVIISGGLLGGNITLMSGGAISDASGLIGSASYATEPSVKGGDVNVIANSLSFTSGAKLGTFTFGGADAGNVNIKALNTVTFDGADSNGGSSNTFSIVAPGAVGKGGEVNISTGSLVVTKGAQLSASTLGQGDAGSVSITATDKVTFDGVGSNGHSSGAFSQVALGAVGKGGDIQIQARSLSLTNGAGVSSSSGGNGAAGSIEITTAQDIHLDHQAFITSNSTGGQGNVTLRSRDLFLRHNSDITTNATGTATGGNITITTGNLVAVPKENSDISANAEESFGGRVTVTAAGIFGTQFRPHLTPLSDITATSQLGPQFNGTVQLNILSPDPSWGLAELPQNVVDPASQIANNPCTKGKNSEFTITGRGGLPPNPNEALNSDAVGVGLVAPVLKGAGGAGEAGGVRKQLSSPNPVVPAQGWVFNEKGQVVLTAYNSAVTQPQRPWRNPGACHTP